ncbi:hypothetical protein [Micromonospora sp. NPDC005979]|uniref:hypothetical protein n=1 Tax=Micromonospora sp. NPDC005979 TaxID=3156726 RepID=UPI0033BDB1BF
MIMKLLSWLSACRGDNFMITGAWGCAATNLQAVGVASRKTLSYDRVTSMFRPRIDWVRLGVLPVACRLASGSASDVRVAVLPTIDA